MTTGTKFIGYTGTYTKGESIGIYSFILDTAAGKITDVKAAAKIENPTYLNISKDSRLLYSVAKDGENGGIASFAVNSRTGELTALNTAMLQGPPPCYVSVDCKNQYTFSANYHTAEVISYKLNQRDGSIDHTVSIIKHEGSGPDPRQEKAHTHYADMTPDGEFMAAVELGSDKLITYRVNNTGELTEVNCLEVLPGSGPRHLVFHPNAKFAYMMTEFSSEVIVLGYDSKNGSFHHIQTITALPAHFSGNNQGSAIHISKDGRFVYAGNRGHNSIGVFCVNEESGELSLVEHVSTNGDWPRDFCMDPTERYIVAANQNSNSLVLFSRNKETGKLTLLQSDVKIPEPVCVKFLNSPMI
jgi:6-phosphogluconolactonase